MPDPSALPALDDCGFVRVPSADGAALWMTCDRCGKSDHFWLADGVVRCRCGARYDHAVRPDGATIPVDQLAFVPFKQGPMQLADLEWDPLRVGAIALVVLIALAGLGWLLLG